MKVSVIPIDRHYEDGRLTYHLDGEPIVVRDRLAINSDRVQVDGRTVLVFEPDTEPQRHDWQTNPRKGYEETTYWTGFRVEVEP